MIFAEDGTQRELTQYDTWSILGLAPLVSGQLKMCKSTIVKRCFVNLQII